MKSILFLTLLLYIKNGSVMGKIIHLEDGPKTENHDGDKLHWLEEQLQIYNVSLELAQANSSFHQGLATYRTQAELEEARARQAKAHKEYIKAQQQYPFFQAPRTRINVGYVGRGYDIFYGNPLSDDGRVDPGFRLPVLQLNYHGNYSADGHYLLPDNVDIIEEPSATFSSSMHEIKTARDYSTMLSEHASVSMETHTWFTSSHFSASQSFQAQWGKSSSSDTMHVDLVGRATAYRARIAASMHTFKVGEFLQTAVAALPDTDCSTHDSLEPYEKIFVDFGTHFTTDVTMGGTSVQRLYMEKSTVASFSKFGVSASMAAGFSGDFFGLGGSINAEIGFGMNTQQKQMVQNMNRQKVEYYIGGTPPKDKDPTNPANTYVLREWARSAAENPAPIQYKLTSIDELLKTDSVFTRPIAGLMRKRECLRKAMFTYCQKHALRPASCNEGVSEQKRRKRSITGKEEANDTRPIRYGDYIHLDSLTGDGETGLVFQENALWASDEPVCYGLGTAKTRNNNESLFQVIPPKGKEHQLMGLPLKFGQPFRLKGRMGQGMILGSLEYPDINNIGSNTLEYFFSDVRFDTNRYGTKQILCSPDKIKNIYILKIQASNNFGICYCVNTTLQLTLEGDKGAFGPSDGLIDLSRPGEDYHSFTTIYMPFITHSVGNLTKGSLKLLPGSHIDPSSQDGCPVSLSLIDVKAKKYYTLNKDMRLTDGEIELDFKSEESMNSGSISASMDDSYYVELAFYSAPGQGVKGTGNTVENNAIGVIHVLTDRPRYTRYWDLTPPDLLNASANGSVSVVPQILTQKDQADKKCDKRLDYPWSTSTLRQASSGKMNGSYWEFDERDKQKFIEFTFPGLFIINAIILSPNLKANATYHSFEDRSKDRWTLFKLNKDKQHIFGYWKINPHVVTQFVRFEFDMQMINVYEIGIGGCAKETKGTDISVTNIPKSFRWTMNYQDIEIITDPVFTIATKSTLPRNLPDIDSDAEKEIVKLPPFKMPPGTRSCDLDRMGTAIRGILGNPVAFFTNFTGKLESDQGDIQLSLEFTVVSYSLAERIQLKKQVKQMVPQHTNLLPCSGPTQAAAQFAGATSGTAAGLRPMDVFLVIVATVALLAVLVIGAIILFRRVKRKPGYDRLNSAGGGASFLDLSSGQSGAQQQLPLETIIAIVDHVLDKRRRESQREEAQMEHADKTREPTGRSKRDRRAPSGASGGSQPLFENVGYQDAHNVQSKV